MADRVARLRLATAAGNVRLAQAIGTALPPRERIAERDFARVERDPLGALDKVEFVLKQPSGRELALYAVERAARKDLQATRAAWIRLRPLVPEADRLYGNGRLAFHAARQHVPDANLWYREAAGASLSDEQHAWRVRAALRAQDMGDVAIAIDAMPAALAQDPAWRYWRARAHAADGRVEEAKRAYAELAKEFNFYGLLAAETLGLPFAPPARATPPTPEELAAFGARPAVSRVVKLAQLDMRMESLREWIPVLRGADDVLLLVAAEFARQQGLTRPRDQYRRPHGRPPRLHAALSHAVQAAVHRRGEGPGRRRGGAVRDRAAGVPLHCRHRVVGGSAGADADHAGDRPLDREAIGRQRLTGPRRSPTPSSIPATARSTSVTCWIGSTTSRRSPPPPIMRAPDARRPGGRPRRSRARRGSRRFPSTRRATT